MGALPIFFAAVVRPRILLKIGTGRCSVGGLCVTERKRLSRRVAVE